MRVIHVTGTAYQRGLEQGDRLGDAIRANVAQMSLTLDVERFLAETAFLAAIDRYTPWLRDELIGIAEAAGVSANDLLAYNMMDERWWYAGQGAVKCTVVARPPLLAQTIDLPHAMDGGQVVVIAHDRQGRCVATLTSAGMIGLAGLNGDGVGVCVNALPMLRHDPAGLPVAFVIRGLLEQRSIAGAIRFLRSVTHASGQHYALADSQTAFGFECSRGAVVQSCTGRELAHTNHPLASHDVDREFTLAPEHARSSHRRLARVRRSGPIATVHDAQQALADRSAPISLRRGDDDRWMTFGAVVLDLGATIRLHVTPGPPSEHRWTTIDIGRAGEAHSRAS